MKRTYNGLVPTDGGPQLFPIKTTQWWLKVIEMGCHNWALVEPTGEASVTIFFFHDLGTMKGNDHGYRLPQVKGRSAVVDSLTFAGEADAARALRHNGFSVFCDPDGVFEIYQPPGEYFDARATEARIYSVRGYWRVPDIGEAIQR